MNARTTRAGPAIAVCIGLLMIVRAGAQAPAYDTSRTVTMTGRVATVVLQYTDRTCLVLGVEAAPGRTERWAIEGNAATALGWGPRTPPLKLGETISVTVFRARPGTNLADFVPGDHSELQEIAKAGVLPAGWISPSPTDGNWRLARGEIGTGLPTKAGPTFALAGV